MSKEKQIEEMAKIFCGMKNGCDGCMWDKVHCNERNYAEEIYNAGYRKQSEGEWIKPTQTHELICNLCGAIGPVDCLKEDFYESNYCPNCGAKMKGE